MINGLFKGRVHELEQNDQRAIEMHNQLTQALDQAHFRENDLKRRLDEAEREIADLRELDSHPHVKRVRMPEVSEYPDPPQPLTATI